MSGPRIAMITNMMAPYRIPLFNQVARLHPAFHVIFLRERESDRAWRIPRQEARFSHETLGGSRGRSGEWKSLLRCNLGVITALRRAHPEAVILGGWSDPENWLALAWCRLKGIPAVVWGGPTANSAKRTNPAVGLMRRLFVRSCRAAVAYHSEAAELLSAMGAPADRVVVGRNVGDIEFYHREVTAIRQAAAPSGGGQTPLLLYVGSFSARKGVGLFLRALRRLPAGLAHRAVLVGAGPEEQAIRDYCAQHRMEQVEFVPFQDREGLAKYFARADIFVLPSLRESGAIVLSEALASGLYTLATCHDGVAPDLVHEGRNGAFFDPADQDAFVEALARAIEAVKREPGLRGRIASEFMQSRPLEIYARAFVQAARLAGGAAAPASGGGDVG